MNILVTGGAGFIGRWVVEALAKDNHRIWILDNLSNGSRDNIKDIESNYSNVKFICGDIKDNRLLEELFTVDFNVCYHLAASINVQDSIDNPRNTFNNDVIGTFNVLEQCRAKGTKLVYVSTCMVYDRAKLQTGISEFHGTCPSSPYSGAKLAGEKLSLSYHYAYDLPVSIVRPFNTYGPYQKSNSEGGVISIFIEKKLSGDPLLIYGSGEQTRDFLYVTDCADFIIKAGFKTEADGKIINAGSGIDISINDLAKMIVGDENKIKHIPHIHPQSEIQKLLCNNDYAKEKLNWVPLVSLKKGLELTESWIKKVR